MFMEMVLTLFCHQVVPLNTRTVNIGSCGLSTQHQCR